MAQFIPVVNKVLWSYSTHKSKHCGREIIHVRSIGTYIGSAHKRQNKCLPTDIKNHKNEQLAGTQKLKKRYTVKLLKKTKKRGCQRDKE